MATVNSAVIEPEDRVLVIERVFDAPRNLVFKAWTDPKHLVNWYGPRGFTLPSCKLELRQGGNWRYCMLSPEGREHWIQGAFCEIVEPERLAFTWAHENANGTLDHETLVTVTFVALGDKTKLTLRQAIFESVAARDEHQNGWTSSLECLAEYLVTAEY